MDLKKWFSENVSRRQALKTMGGLAGAGLVVGTGTANIHDVLARKASLAATPTISPTATGTGDATSIQHVLIACDTPPGDESPRLLLPLLCRRWAEQWSVAPAWCLS